MAGPWENYQPQSSAAPTPEPRQYVPIAQPATQQSGPWQNYAPQPAQQSASPNPANVVGTNGRAPGAVLSQGQDGSISADNVSRAAATGVPIIGGVLNTIDAATNATLAPLVDPFLPDSFQKLPEGNWSDRYQHALDIQQGKDQAFSTEHPVANAASQIAGGVGAAIPVVAAAPALFGAGEASLPIRMLAGGAGGAGVGAADAITRSNGDPRSVGIGAGLGAVLGAAGPAVGEVAGNIYRNASTNAAQGAAAEMAGASRPAVDVVTRALAADNSLGNAGANLAAAGPRAMLADAGPSVQTVLDAAIQRAGPGAGEAAQRVGNRATAASADINRALDTAFGQDQGMIAPLDAIRNASQPARAAAYNEAYNTPINYASPQGQTLQTIVESRVPGNVINRANNLMRVEGAQSRQIHANIDDNGNVTFQRLPDVQQLDYITRALNDVARSGDGQGALGGNTAEGRAYGNLASTIRGLLGSDELVPQYRTALNTAAEPIQQREAMQFGQTMLSPSVTRDEVQAFTSGLTDPQLASVRAGVRSQIGEALANVRRTISDPNIDARQGVQAIRDLSSDAARQKVSSILGENEANGFFRALDEAARSFDLRAGVAQNSRTYARQAAERAVDAQTAPGVLETAAQGKPLEAGKTFAQRLLGTGPEAQLARSDTAWSDIANLLTQPATPNSPFFQAINSAANRLPVIDRTANSISRGITRSIAAVAPQIDRQALPSRKR